LTFAHANTILYVRAKSKVMKMSPRIGRTTTNKKQNV